MRYPVAREVCATLLAFVFAPLAAVAVNTYIVFLLTGAFGVLNATVAPPGIVFVVEAFSLFARDFRAVMTHAYVITWLVVFPQIVVFKARKLLSLWAVLVSAVVLPLATVSALTLLVWSGTSATTSQMLAVFALLFGTTLPSACAAALTFWALYAIASRRPARRLPAALAS